MHDSTQSEHDPDLVPRPLRPSTNINIDGATAVRANFGIENQDQTMETLLTRKCSYCHEKSGNTCGEWNRNRKTDGTTRARDTPGAIAISESLAEDEVGNNENMALPSTSIDCSRPLLVDVEDHEGCYQECCAMDCHNGCIGHASPNAAIGTTSAEPEEQYGKFGFIKHVLRNLPSFRRNHIVSGTRLGTRQTRQVAGLENPTETEKSRPGGYQQIFCGNPSPGALAAAKTAMLKNYSEANMTRPVTAPKSAPATRNVSWATVVTPADNSTGFTGKRKVSGASMASVKTIEVPGLCTVGDLLESLMIPSGALRMHLQQHPWVWDCAGGMMERLMEMISCVTDTVKRVYKVSYVYSKTGTLKVKDMGALVRDCVRSVVYLLILGVVIVLVCRVLGVFVRIAKGFFWMLRGIACVLKKLGLGLLW